MISAGGETRQEPMGASAERTGGGGRTARRGEGETEEVEDQEEYQPRAVDGAKSTVRGRCDRVAEEGSGGGGACGFASVEELDSESGEV